MCSVAGIVALSGSISPDPTSVRRMNAALAHRGPDGHGEYRDGAAHLAMNRLAIVGGPRIGLPLRNETGKIVVVWNGEIYNHVELRADLRERAHYLRSESDGELISHLYEEHGVDFVKRLRGMFAIALWDATRRRLVLARDRIGIKPLFYATADAGRTLLFASECKAILASGLVERALDPQAIDDYFVYTYPVPPRTMFAGISALPPGHVLVAEAGRTTLQAYWDLEFPRAGEEERRSPARWAEEFRALLETVVREHLPDEVPFAAYLSGGIDSSVIAALAVRERGTDVPTLSAGFADPRHDESEHFTAMARHLGTANHQVSCGDECAGVFPDMLWHLEIPSWFPIGIPHLQLARLARERGLPVVLSGEGADELLGGYDAFRADKIRRSLDRPLVRRLRPALYDRLYRWAGAPRGVAAHMERVHRDADAAVQRYGLYPPWYDAWRLLADDAPALYGPRTCAGLGAEPHAATLIDRAMMAGRSPLNQGLYFETKTRLPGFILTVGDRATMAAGVELRVPFLDHRLVEFCARVPADVKLAGLTTKALLRNATRDLLPHSINKRPKKPFFTPIGPWFFEGRRPDYVRELLEPETVRAGGYFDPDAVSGLDAALATTPHDTVRRYALEWELLGVLSVQLMHRMFVEGTGFGHTLDDLRYSA